MTIARKCDACGEMIDAERYTELRGRLLRTAEDECQDAIVEVGGDYHDGCIASGAAVADVMAELIRQAEKKDRSE